MATLVATARTNDSEVSEIIETVLTAAQINAFINAASALVDAHLTDKGLSSTLLTQIEKWLAAHLLSMRDQRAASEQLGPARIAYQGQTGLGLNATTYGQQVLVLDGSGALAGLGRKRATVRAYSEYDTTDGAVGS